VLGHNPGRVFVSPAGGVTPPRGGWLWERAVRDRLLYDPQLSISSR